MWHACSANSAGEMRFLFAVCNSFSSAVVKLPEELEALALEEMVPVVLITDQTEQQTVEVAVVAVVFRLPLI